MKKAKEFREIARDSLKGKWKIAVIVGLVAALLGGTEGIDPDVNVNFDAANANASLEVAGQTVFSTAEGFNSALLPWIVGGFTYVMIIALITGVAYFMLSSVISVGYARFNLNLVDRQEASFENLFGYFSWWKTTVIAKLLQTLYIILWSLLFVIPGIIAGYSYAMTKYILAENPEISASEAISRSKEMMKGNRLRLFGLELSFIGWAILSSFTLGIGNLWLNPYREAAIAAFYREVSRGDNWI